MPLNKISNVMIQFETIDLSRMESRKSFILPAERSNFVSSGITDLLNSLISAALAKSKKLLL